MYVSILDYVDNNAMDDGRQNEKKWQTVFWTIDKINYGKEIPPGQY